MLEDSKIIDLQRRWISSELVAKISNIFSEAEIAYLHIQRESRLIPNFVKLSILILFVFNFYIICFLNSNHEAK